MSVQSLMIRASAGSGKTYQLANRFLALLALGVEPSRVIALTFTRKAAGEFADRILHRLAEGAASPEGAAKLADDLRRTLEGDAAGGQPGLLGAGGTMPELGRAMFGDMLEKLVGSMDRLALGTFDSFFTRIARTSCHELGMGGFSLLDDAELRAEKDRTFARIFSRLGGQAARRADFLDAFKRATLGTEENRFVETLDKFIDAHHSRYLANPEAEVWGGARRLWPAGSPWPVDVRYAELAGLVMEALENEAWSDKRWAEAMRKLMEFFMAYSPGQPGEPPGLFAKLMDVREDLAAGSGAPKYYKEHTISGDVAVMLAELTGGYVGAEIRIKLAQTRGLFAVMDCYEALYGRDTRGRGKLGFGDLTVVLAHAGLGTDGAGQNIGYRLDQWFDHWMLDEFQDTNRLQWKVLAGLIQEVQQDDTGKRSFFVVGDPKQGVHAWRGGEPRLFDEIAADWQGALPEWSMAKSWRSAPAVLDLVNHICEPGQQWMTERFPDAALARWKFSRHEAGKPGLKGESLVLEVALTEPDAADEGDDIAESKPAWPAVAAIIREYQPLEHGMTCAVLVQKNDIARGLADYLRGCLPGMPIEVETETPMAADGPVGAALLDFFRWLHAPADTLALGHLMHCPMRLAMPLALGGSRPEDWWHTARGIAAAEGFGGLMDRLAAAVRAVHTLDEFNVLRLEAWQIEARQFDVAGGSPADWLRRLEAWKTREYSQAGAIQIMTVHKSKGLEFDMVLLPDLGGKAFDDTGMLGVLEDQRDDGHVAFLTLSPRKSVIGSDPALASLLDKWGAAQCYERFCNLYVAMTRAKHGLYLILPALKPAKSKSAPEPKRTYSDWVRAATAVVAPSDRVFAPDGMALTVLQANGDDAWRADFARPEETSAAAAPVVLVPASAPPRPRTPSGEKLDAGKRAGNACRDRRGAMDFGTNVHAAFEAIGWLDDGAPAPHPDPDVRGLVEKCLAAPAVRALFTRTSGEVELWREQAFDWMDGGGWVSGVIDRMHVHRVGDKVTKVVIIDYKTDHVERGDELVARYGKQMQSYREAMASILRVPPAMVDCVLVSTCLAEVVELGTA